jgi:hypothetical protein
VTSEPGGSARTATAALAHTGPSSVEGPPGSSSSLPREETSKRATVISLQLAPGGGLSVKALENALRSLTGPSDFDTTGIARFDHR